MIAQLSENYRMEGRSLFEKQGDAFIHVATVPVGISGIKDAVSWYKDNQTFLNTGYEWFDQ